MATCYHWSLHITVLILDRSMTSCYQSLIVLILDHTLQSWMTTVYECWLWTVHWLHITTVFDFKQCSFGTLQQPVDHRSSDNSYNNTLMKFSSVSHSSVRDLLTVFVPYFNILTLAIYFFTNVSCVQILHMKIVYFHSCTTFLLKYCVLPCWVFKSLTEIIHCTLHCNPVCFLFGIKYVHVWWSSEFTCICHVFNFILW